MLTQPAGALAADRQSSETSHTSGASETSEILQPRQADRFTINKEFESFDAFIQEYVTNISRTGVFIKSKTPLPIGTEVTLRFTLIMEDIETIEGKGEVVRVANDPAGMGITFKELSPESRTLIERLLAAT